MHNFDELIYRGTTFTLNALKEVNSKVIEELQTSASTISVKNLQMMQLQKAILAVGMFALFDSILQEGLSCRNGFEESKKILTKNEKVELCNHFDNFICAIIMAEELPYSLNSEMSIYDNPYQGEKSDLSIHRINAGILYTNKNSHIENLEFAIEIKYANAKSPDFDFIRQSVNDDIRKLESLGNKVRKLFVFIDEADRTSKANMDWLIEICRKMGIILFTNNKYINNHPDFIYGKQFLLAVQE